MAFYIWQDKAGKEIKREVRGRGRPRNDAKQGSDGNWYIQGLPPVAQPMVAGSISIAKVVDAPVTVRPATGDGSVLTPAGKCPVKLDSIDPEVVQEWARRVKATDNRLSRGAIEYYVREFFSYGTAEHTAVLKVLNG